MAVIGDRINPFKHAYPQGIEFDKSHSGTHDEELIECRRCPALVVELACALIAHNHGRTPRALLPRPNNPAGEVHVLQWPTIEAEAQGVAEIIRKRIQSKEVEPGRVLVLAPRRQFGYESATR